MTEKSQAAALELDIVCRRPGFTLTADFVAPPGVTALFGRSGAGKTTLANAVAGLLRPCAGRIALGGETVFDRDAGVWTPPHRRRLGYVFQEGRLFPHLDVRGNLLYPQRFAPPAAAPTQNFDDVVSLLGLAPLLHRRPDVLSGGERQRAAIGRALLGAPRMLILDEPLASLDAGRKTEILPFLERLRDELALPMLYVSHSVAEIARLAETVVALADGRVARVGPTPELLSDPDVFPLMGRQEAGAVLEARVVAVDVGDGLAELAVSGGRLFVPAAGVSAGARLRVRVRARDVMIARTAPSEVSALNILPATVAALGKGDGAIVEVALVCGGDRLLARITRRSAAALNLAPGVACFALLKTVAIGRRDLGADPREAG